MGTFNNMEDGESKDTIQVPEKYFPTNYSVHS